jgi:hypothetical protein
MTEMQVIDTAEKYFTEILRPDREEFFGEPATPRRAFHLAASLFHFHEWL